jgi:uncharacterized protein (DUF934 family)
MSEPTSLLEPLKPVAVSARLWRDGRFVEDTWTYLQESDPIGEKEAIVVSLQRWQREHAVLRDRSAPIGVSLPVAVDLASLSLVLPFVQLIVLAFPKFGDGRSYSTARQIRDMGFGGELRATGDVLLDQIPLMLRAGFNALEIVDFATIRALATRPLPTMATYLPHRTSSVIDGFTVQSSQRDRARKNPITIPPQSTGRS